MLYGIQYIPSGGPFQGLKVALMEDYGLPLLFRDLQKARDIAEERRLPRSNYAPEPVVRRLVGNIVEFYSGRLRIVSTGKLDPISLQPERCFVLFDSTKLSYEQFLARRHVYLSQRKPAISNLHLEKTSPRPKLRLLKTFKDL